MRLLILILCCLTARAATVKVTFDLPTEREWAGTRFFYRLAQNTNSFFQQAEIPYPQTVCALELWDGYTYEIHAAKLDPFGIMGPLSEALLYTVTPEPDPVPQVPPTVIAGPTISINSNDVSGVSIQWQPIAGASSYIVSWGPLGHTYTNFDTITANRFTVPISSGNGFVSVRVWTTNNAYGDSQERAFSIAPDGKLYRYRPL